MYRTIGKRLIDFSASVLILGLLAPFLLLVALLIKLDSAGPVFFIQQRVGKDFREINLLKFRSMTNKPRRVAPVHGRAEGVTKIGYWIRRFKIDELPQLINVLKGEMSLIGPRPSIREQLSQMTEQEKRRYSVRPGLTGLAQISGNIHISWKERFKFDLIYIDNISLINDIKIFFRTFLIVIRGEEKFVNRSIKIITRK